MQHARQALHGMLGERSRAWAAVWQPRPTKLCATTEPLVHALVHTVWERFEGIGLHLSTFMSTFLYEPNDPPFSCVGRARPVTVDNGIADRHVQNLRPTRRETVDPIG